MLHALLMASDELNRGRVHFERFAALPPVDSVSDHAFQVVLASTGDTIDVPADRSILQALRDSGHDVESCGEGTCGTCILDVLEGELDHRDSILTDEEKAAGDCLGHLRHPRRRSRLLLDL